MITDMAVTNTVRFARMTRRAARFGDKTIDRRALHPRAAAVLAENATIGFQDVSLPG
jgi:hypothetical protein